MTPPGARGRALVLAPGALGERLSGPEIRALRLARALEGEYAVTLMAPGVEPGERDGARLVPFSRRALLREARAHDLLLAATIPPFALMLKRRLGVVAVSDQYDPVELELGTLEGKSARACATARAARRLQLRLADLVLCAGARQHEVLETELDSLGLRGRVPICTVPFGIDRDPAPGSGSPLRERFPQIGPEDRIVLWWGSLWRWLDAETAIRAVAALAAKRPEVKLVFTAGRAPNGGFERHSVVGAARSLAAELGVLDRSVFFLEEWVPYERRAEYLREADVGLTLHRATDEARLAARARYMDYLWAGLPCVLGRGDETADRFEADGFARLVGPESPDEVGAAILSLLEAPAAARARTARVALAEELRWERVTAPLPRALGEIAPPRAGGRPTQVGPTASYYARRLTDRLLPSH